MAKRSGKCINIGNCDVADKKQIVDIVAGQDFVCPDCGSDLHEVRIQPSGKNRKLIYFFGLLPLLLLAIGYGMYSIVCPSGCWPSPTPQPTQTPIASRSRTPETSEPLPVDRSPELPNPPQVPDSNNSVLRGVVELGATGFNYFVIRISATANNNTNKLWKLEDAKFGWSLVFEKMATKEDIYRTLKDYIGNILNFGVAGKDIHFIVSSGAGQDPAVQKIMSILKERFGYIVNTVTPSEEAVFGLKSLLTKEREKDSFVVDIGTSNTKLSWVDDRGNFVGHESFGSGYPKKGIGDEDIMPDIQSKLSVLPIDRRKYCFIIGGSPFELASKVLASKYGISPKDVVKSRKPGDRYTKLNTPGDYKPDTDKQRAGLNIYKAIADTTGCKNFIFDWDANFSIGFLLSLR